MTGPSIAKYVNPWKFRRELEAQRQVQALRQRDGDNCRRCRRPMRFDAPSGHDQGPAVEPIQSNAGKAPLDLENLCLCHSRCNALGGDHTGEVRERIRRKNEAELFARSRTRKRA